MEAETTREGIQQLLDALFDAFSKNSRIRWQIIIKTDRLSPEAARFAVNKIDAGLAAIDELEARL